MIRKISFKGLIVLHFFSFLLQSILLLVLSTASNKASCGAVSQFFDNPMQQYPVSREAPALQEKGSEMDSGFEAIPFTLFIVGGVCMTFGYVKITTTSDWVTPGSLEWLKDLIQNVILLVAGYNLFRAGLLLLGSWHDQELLSRGENLAFFAMLGFVAFCLIKVLWDFVSGQYRLFFRIFELITALCLALVTQGLIYLTWDYFNISSRLVS